MNIKTRFTIHASTGKRTIVAKKGRTWQAYPYNDDLCMTGNHKAALLEFMGNGEWYGQVISDDCMLWSKTIVKAGV